MSDANPMPEADAIERLRARGAKLRLTRQGRVHTVDFREAGERITDGDALLAAGLERLHELCLAGTSITDAAIAPLSALPKLETLDLENTAVTDAALDELVRMRQLKLLVLRGTSISREAIGQLRKQMIGTRIVG